MTWVIIAGVMSETEDTLPAKPNTKDEVRKEIELDFSWGTEGFGAIMKANFTISNKSHKAIKDIKIHCLHFAGSETKIDQNTKVIYEVIEAHSKRSFRHVNMGFIRDQVKRSSCSIEDFSIVQ